MKLSADVYFDISGGCHQDVTIDGGKQSSIATAGRKLLSLKASVTHDVSTVHLIHALALNHRMRQGLLGHQK